MSLIYLKLKKNLSSDFLNIISKQFLKTLYFTLIGNIVYGQRIKWFKVQ